MSLLGTSAFGNDCNIDDVTLQYVAFLPCECGMSLSPTTLTGGAHGDAYNQTVTAPAA